ncbi:MAG: 4-hydroxybenzoate octaprenyltransferase [Parvibaculales bacterium]
MQDIATTDSETNSWVNHLPPPARPYARMMRLDRPIGSWLLFLPCLWSLSLAASQRGNIPPIDLILLFGLGAVIMRGAGCVYNDIVDRDLDRKVKRTRNRPLAAGTVSLGGAWAFLFILCGCGLLILLQLDIAAIALGLMSVGLVALYPFMKRITWWPQLFLGLTFNWGALMGYAAYAGSLNAESIALYVAGVFWTLGYDTIYAHQDREDDALAGIKSSALRLGRHTRTAVSLFYAITGLVLISSALLAGLNWPAYLLILPGLAHLFWQIRNLDIDNPDQCLYLFKSNRGFGLIIALAFLAGQ